MKLGLRKTFWHNQLLSKVSGGVGKFVLTALYAAKILLRPFFLF